MVTRSTSAAPACGCLASMRRRPSRAARPTRAGSTCVVSNAAHACGRPRFVSPGFGATDTQLAHPAVSMRCTPGWSLWPAGCTTLLHLICAAAGERSKQALLEKIGKGKVQCEQASVDVGRGRARWRKGCLPGAVSPQGREMQTAACRLLPLCSAFMVRICAERPVCRPQLQPNASAGLVARLAEEPRQVRPGGGRLLAERGGPQRLAGGAGPGGGVQASPANPSCCSLHPGRRGWRLPARAAPCCFAPLGAAARAQHQAWQGLRAAGAPPAGATAWL